MATQRAPSKANTTIISTAQAQAGEAVTAGLKTAQQALTAKLASLQTEAGTLAAKSPAAAAAAARIAHFQGLSQAVATLSQENNSLPTLSAGSFILHGRITDATGKPLPNYVLNLSDSKQSLKDRIPPVRSDAQGFFTVTLRAAEFPDLAKEKTDLFVTVMDQAGREAYAPDTAVQLVAGQMAIFSAVDTPPVGQTG